jgi:hypothetical protein
MVEVEFGLTGVDLIGGNREDSLVYFVEGEGFLRGEDWLKLLSVSQEGLDYSIWTSRTGSGIKRINMLEIYNV